MGALKAKEGVVIDKEGKQIVDHRVGPTLNKFYRTFSDNWMTVASVAIFLPLFLFAGAALFSIAALAIAALWGVNRAPHQR